MTTVMEIAASLGMDGRRARRIMRKAHAIEHEHGAAWHLTPAQADIVRSILASADSPRATAKPAPELTSNVVELVTTRERDDYLKAQRRLAARDRSDDANDLTERETRNAIARMSSMSLSFHMAA